MRLLQVLEFQIFKVADEFQDFFIHAFQFAALLWLDEDALGFRVAQDVAGVGIRETGRIGTATAPMEVIAR